MENRSLKELEKDGKKTLKELEKQTRGKDEEKARLFVKMVAEKEGVDFDELWDAVEYWEERCGYGGVDVVEFSIPEHVPIRYWFDTKEINGWLVCAKPHSKSVCGLGKALVIAKRAYEDNPHEFERVVVK